MEFSSGKLWVVCTLCPTLDAALAAFCLSRFHVSPLFTVDEIMRITPRLINILLLNLPPHLQCLNFLVRHSSTYFLSLLSLFPPLNPQRYLWISFSIFGKNIYFKREITASQLPSSSYPAICSILILFCLFLLCERAEAEAWQPGLRHASLHLSKPSSLTPPLPSPPLSRPGASYASVICRRARLGAAHSQRLLPPGLPCCHGRWREARHHQLRLQGHRLTQHREG